MNEGAFDDIVAGFYRAASGAIEWGEALLPFQRAMAALAVDLHGFDTARGRLVFGHAANDMPVESGFDYVRTYHRLDPRTEHVLAGRVGTWFNCWDVFDDAFVAHHRFYQEYLIPYGGRYVSGTKLLEDEDTCVILGVHRGLGSARLDPDEIATCRRLAGHLTGALTMHREQLRLLRENRLGLEVSTRLRAPVLLIDDQRRIQQSNPAARALIAMNEAVFASNGRLCCRRACDDAALLEALRGSLAGGRKEAGPSRQTMFTRARASSSDVGLVLYLDALRPEETLRVFGERPLVMVTIHDLRERLKLDPFMVATAFGLTPGEAKVAVAIAEGASADQIAKRHRTSIHTVRSQVQTTLQKTGTTRQAELVGVLAGLPCQFG